MKEIALEITKATKAVQTAEVFAAKYSAKLPDGLGAFACGNFGADFTIYLRGRSPSDRDKALILVGDVFGRGGWVAESAYGHDGFHWKQVVDGVAITIQYAQEIDSPKTFPVNPNQFPVQLENA